MDLASILRGMLADVEAEEAAQNSKGESYTNRGDGSQNITRRKTNSGQKSGDRTTYNFTTNNYSLRSAQKKIPPRNKTSDMSLYTNNSLPDISNTPIFYGDTPTFHGDSNENIHQNQNPIFLSTIPNLVSSSGVVYQNSNVMFLPKIPKEDKDPYIRINNHFYKKKY